MASVIDGRGVVLRVQASLPDGRRPGRFRHSGFPNVLIGVRADDLGAREIEDWRTHPVRREVTIADFDIHTTVRGDVTPGAREYAEQKIIRAARVAHRPVLFARLELRQEADSALERPAIAKASLDVSGKRLRAHVAAPTMTQAADRLADRLRQGFEVLAKQRARRRDSGEPEPGQWRHGYTAAERPTFFPRPPGERRIMRRSSFGIGPISPEEAADEMELLHHDFLLFSDVTTGTASVIYRRPDNRFGLIAAGPHADRSHPYSDAIVLDPAPATIMTLREAIERLDATNDPFVFFVDAGNDRGSIVYRRYDGHYGLLTSEHEGAATSLESAEDASPVGGPDT